MQTSNRMRLRVGGRRESEAIDTHGHTGPFSKAFLSLSLVSSFLRSVLRLGGKETKIEEIYMGTKCKISLESRGRFVYGGRETRSVM